jgi:hypothetical protein
VSRVWASGSTTAYRKFRALILARDKYACQLRLPGCTITGNQLHHLLGVAVSGKVCAPEHACASCFACNRSIGEVKGDPHPSSRTAW